MRRGVVILGLALSMCAPAHASLPPGFIGLYGDDSYFGDPGYRSQQMGIQARIGVQTVRQPFEWSRVERRPAQFDWSAYDGYVADAAAAGLSVLPVLVGPPGFRSSKPPKSRSRAMYPPKRNADFARFVRSAVEPYGPG